MGAGGDLPGEAIAHSPDPLTLIDETGQILWVNRAAVEADPSVEWVGSSIFDRLHPDDHQEVLLSVGTVQDKDGAGSPLEVRVSDSSGQYRLFEVVGRAYHSAAGGTRIAAAFRELTERRRWEVAQGDVEAFQTILQASATLTLLMGPDGALRSASASLGRQLGHDSASVEGSQLVDLVAPDDRHHIAELLDPDVAHDHRQLVTLRLLHREGHSVPFEMTIVDLREDAVIGGFVLSGHDVSELAAARQRLTHLATHDVLTGLPNRTLFLERLVAARARTRRSGQPFVVFFCDLDGFKAVNDQFGHGEGDRILARVGDQLRTSLRELDFIARLGGDEFVAIAEDIGGENARMVAHRMEQAVAATESKVPIGASVGYTMSGADDDELAVLARADAAMYKRKQLRRRGETAS